MNKIINILKEKKSIPLDQFINISLYNKKFGYYMTKNPFGKEGDFITAPEISQLFGEIIGLWIYSIWKNDINQSEKNCICLNCCVFFDIHPYKCC